MQERKLGHVESFNEAKGFGFIIPEGGGPKIFVHHTAIDAEGFRVLQEGDFVSFEVGDGPKVPQAQHVRLVR